MRDPLTWTLPLGRVFGITVRVHLLFPLVVLGLILRVAFSKQVPPLPDGAWRDMAVIEGLLFLAVLLHEFGHCFGGRLMDGDAQEILLWPLGGLASVDVPHTPRAHFITAAAGPLVNLTLGLACLFLLGFAYHGLLPPLHPFLAPLRDLDDGTLYLDTWNGSKFPATGFATVIARFFWVNWVLFLINVLLIGFPLDGGRMFQSVLWHFVGYRQATLAAIFAGFITMLLVGLFAIVSGELLALCLAAFIYVSCKQQWILLETGGEESMFGYDFSQGYTSLEREAPPRRRQSWWQRWLQRRAARKLQRAQEQRDADERRTDELLEKIQREGKQALTDEEQRFLKRVSDRYRNRH